MAKRGGKSRRSFSPDHYFNRSQRPLHAMIILLPMIIVYKVAMIKRSPETGGPILAERFLNHLFSMFGAVGYYLPGLAVVGVLLAWHFAKRDPWAVEPKTYLAMVAEAFALAAAFLMFTVVMMGRPTASQAPLGYQIALSLGAGVFEELVFRLMLIALIHMLVVDLLKAPQKSGAIAAILGSSVLFSVYHFLGVDADGNPIAFSFTRFIYYALAGVYLAGIYLLRGFGIVAATHALYNVLISLLASSYSTAN